MNCLNARRKYDADKRARQAKLAQLFGFSALVRGMTVGGYGD